MAGEGAAGARQGVAILAGAGIAGVGATVLWWAFLGGAPVAPPPAPEAAPVMAVAEPAAEAAPAPDVAATTGMPAEASPEPAADAAADAVAETASPENAGPEAAGPEAAAAGIPEAPAFDVVRAEADGSVVLAGKAEPGATVRVMLDGAEVARADADQRGRFAALLTLEPSDAARVLTLMAGEADQVAVSSESVILAPQPAAVDGAATAEAPADAAAPPEGTAVFAESSAPEAPAVLMVDDAGVRVLQPPAAETGLPDTVAIDAISYGAAGQVQLAGRTTDGAGTVRVYIDNAPVGDAVAGDDGGWNIELPGIEAGVHQLRVDQIDAAGKVVSRSETPFKRELPEVLAALAAPPAAQAAVPPAATSAAVPEGGATAPMPRPVRASVITVQPGFTLWGIARESYGEGLMYVQVWEANRDLIRDPDLIYPGQIFTVPAAAAGSNP